MFFDVVSIFPVRSVHIISFDILSVKFIYDVYIFYIIYIIYLFSIYINKRTKTAEDAAGPSGSIHPPDRSVTSSAALLIHNLEISSPLYMT